MWTQIRLLLQEQSDLDPHCLMASKTFQQATNLIRASMRFWYLTHRHPVMAQTYGLVKAFNSTIHSIVEDES